MRKFFSFGSEKVESKSGEPTTEKKYEYLDFLRDITAGRSYEELSHACDKHDAFHRLYTLNQHYSKVLNSGMDCTTAVLKFMLRYKQENLDYSNRSQVDDFSRLRHVAYMHVQALQDVDRSLCEDLIPYIQGITQKEHQEHVTNAFRNSYTQSMFCDGMSYYVGLREQRNHVRVDPVISLSFLRERVSFEHHYETRKKIFRQLNIPVNTRDPEGNSILHAIAPLNRLYVNSDFIQYVVRSIYEQGFEDRPNIFGMRGIDALLHGADINVRNHLKDGFGFLFPSALPEYPDKNTHPFEKEATRLKLCGLSHDADIYQKSIVNPRSISSAQEERLHKYMEAGEDVRELLHAHLLSHVRSGSSTSGESRLFFSIFSAPNAELRSSYFLLMIQHNEFAREELLKRIIRKPEDLKKYELSESIKNYYVDYLSSRGVEDLSPLDRVFVQPQTQLDLGL